MNLDQPFDCQNYDVKTKGLARIFLNRGIKCFKISAITVGQKKHFLVFRSTKTIKFGTISMISQAHN